MHIGQGVATELQAQRRHQHQGVHAWVRHRLQVVAVDNQFALGIAGVAVVRTFLAITAQAIQVRRGAGQNQCGLATGRITNDANLIGVDEGGQHAVAQGGRYGFGNLDRPAVQVTQSTEAAVVPGVVTGVDHRHHDETFACQRGGEVVQGQGGSGVAVGQHQHREPANSDLGVLPGFDGITLEFAGVLPITGRIEGDGAHRLKVQWVEKRHLMKADAPVRMRCRRGVHCIQAAEQANQ
ncbi:hypothetical protein D9M71_197100 [compost metagenome]